MASKHTKKALCLSMLSILLCLSMLVGSTFAWFTDTASTGVNTIVAGNLDIALYEGTQTVENGKVTAVDYANEVSATKPLFKEGVLWEPGHTEVAYLKLENKGSLALKYKLTVQVNNEVVGTSVTDKEIHLSQVLKYDVVNITEGQYFQDRDAALAAVTEDKTLAIETIPGEMQAHAPAQYMAIIVYMPTGVDNDANHKTGTQPPSIQLGVTLAATQLESESDSFDSTYDEKAEYPILPVVFDEKLTFTTDANGAAFAASADNDISVSIPVGALPADTDANLAFELTESSSNSYTYEISLIDENDQDISLNGPVTVSVKIGPGLENVKVKHNGAPMAESSYTYDKNNGTVAITTDSFSPFVISFTEKAYDGLPKADVEKLDVSTPVPLNQQFGSLGQETLLLETAYNFKTTDTLEQAKASPYRYWHADFVVSVDKDIAANTIILAGNYGSYGWLAFSNEGLPVAENQEIRLLESAAGIYMNYEELCSLVKEFKCGAADVDNALTGTTLTVELRLFETTGDPTNEDGPKNIETGKSILINKYQHTFE